MSDANALIDLVACPRCDRSPLAAAADGFGCPACKTAFGALRGIPWLFADPEASLGEWRNRLHYELQRLAREADALRAESVDDCLRPLTRRRLELKREAVETHRKALRQLLAPVDLQSRAGSFESHLALRTRLPLDQGLHTYYANVHRDWCWGEAENEASLDQVRSVAGATIPGNLLVLGAGACRLAYDLHMRLGPGRTVALDFNPLLLLIADRVLRGESLELHEFPIAPLALEDVAPLRRLAAPGPVREGFYLLAGDVLRPPFRPGAFDTVVTPWLIDIVTEDLPLFAARLNRLLAAGGRWINFGSLAFDRPEHARCYSREEVLAIAGEAGFDAAACQEAVIPYMCSPASRHGRQENVFTFSLTKTAEVSPPARHKALPDWLVTGKEAVPLSPAFQAQVMTTRIYAFVMSLIDGRRTIEDLAALMEREKLMRRDEAVPAIRRFLTRMYDDSQRGR